MEEDELELILNVDSIKDAEMTTTEQDRAQMEEELEVATQTRFKNYPFMDKMDVSHFTAGWNERNKKVMELQARIDELITTDHLQKLLDAPHFVPPGVRDSITGD